MSTASDDVGPFTSVGCLGCGEPHPASERLCPRTKRSVGDGPFGSLVGPYRVGKLLGAGGFGVVHVAHDERSGASVALKLLHPEFVADPDMLDRFMREVEVTVRAGNPHIVRVLGASFTGRAVYVALELLAGDTLANTMRAGPIEPLRAVDIAIQVLDGLAVAHAAGVIHRDIKPANIFLSDELGAPRSLVKILDFGIGRLLLADETSRITHTGTQLGTPHFMAPEQITDSKRADARADLYAVAVTLFAMLTGERPYGQMTVGDWLDAVALGVTARRASSPLGPLPSALVETIAIGLSIDPAKRFQDAGSLARALLDSIPESPTLTRALPALARTATFVSGASLPKTVSAAASTGCGRAGAADPTAARASAPAPDSELAAGRDDLAARRPGGGGAAGGPGRRSSPRRWRLRMVRDVAGRWRLTGAAGGRRDAGRAASPRNALNVLRPVERHAEPLRPPGEYHIQYATSSLPPANGECRCVEPMADR